MTSIIAIAAPGHVRSGRRVINIPAHRASARSFAVQERTMRADDRGRVEFRHFSGHVLCPRRGGLAVISAVERQRGAESVRTIFWCSLRGGEQWCAEECGAPTEAPVAEASAGADAR
jgi:hypothetical protein